MPHLYPTPADHAMAARAHLSAAATHFFDFADLVEEAATPPYILSRHAQRCHLQALLGVGSALLAVAGQLEAIREGDGR